MEILQKAIDFLPTLTVIVTSCAAIAAVTPTKVDNRVCQVILDIVNFLAINFGKAKNADSDNV